MLDRFSCGSAQTTINNAVREFKNGERRTRRQQEDLPVAICITIMKKGSLSRLRWYSIQSMSDNSPRNIDSERNNPL
jgi:hypothetical protein